MPASPEMGNEEWKGGERREWGEEWWRLEGRERGAHGLESAAVGGDKAGMEGKMSGGDGGEGRERVEVGGGLVVPVACTGVVSTAGPRLISPTRWRVSTRWCDQYIRYLLSRTPPGARRWS